MTRGGPQGQLTARRVARDDHAPGIGLRQQLAHEGGQRVERGRDVVEGVRPATRDRTTGAPHRTRPALRGDRAALRLGGGATPPILDVRHGKTTAGQEVRERGDVATVVRGAPGTAVQDDHERGEDRGVRLARDVEVDHLVGVVAVRGGDVGVHGRVREGRRLFRGVALRCGPVGCGVVLHAPTSQR